MSNFTDETKSEIIKSFAYGLSTEEVAKNEEISVEEATAFQEDNKNAIEDMKKYLKEEGWIE